MRFYANLLGLSVVVGILLVAFGWAIVLEPSPALRALAGATIVATGGVSACAVLLAHRAATRKPPNRLVISDWGVEFDAPARRPDVAPPESGGALAWTHVGRVDIDNRFWAMKRAGLFEVTFYSREFRRGPFALTVPRLWPWGVCVPYLRREDAERVVGMANGRFVVEDDVRGHGVGLTSTPPEVTERQN